MTETVLKQIVHRAVSDGSFRAQLRSDPATALAGIGLTAEEQAALTSGDPARLTALGVDQRMSKAFSAGLLSEASKTVIVTDAGAGGAAFIDEGTERGGNAVIVGDPLVAAASATLVQDIQSLSDLHMKLNEQDLNTGAAAVDADVAPAGGPTSRLWQVEQDLNAGTSLEAPADAPFASHVRQIEQDLDAGASLEAPSGDVETEGTQVTDVNQDY